MNVAIYKRYTEQPVAEMEHTDLENAAFWLWNNEPQNESRISELRAELDVRLKKGVAEFEAELAAANLAKQS